MASSGDTLYILTPIESPHDIVRRIVEDSYGLGQTVVLDLSVGSLVHPSPLRKRGREYENQVDDFRWIDGQEFAAEVGDSSRETYVEWISEVADRPLTGGKSIKEMFTYRGEISLWWFTTMSEKDFEGHPFRWIFYMFAVVDRLLAQDTTHFSEAHIWTGMPHVGHAVEQKLVGRGVSAQVHSVAGQGRRWSSGRFTSEQDRNQKLLPRIVDAMGKLLVRIKILIRDLIFFQTTLQDLQYESALPSEEGEPLFLVQSQSPDSWRSREFYDAVGEEVDYLDHYYGDMPFRLQRRGIDIALLPEVTWSNYDDWIEKSAGYPLESALPWMTVSVGQTFGLILHQIRWLLFFVWTFGVNRIHDQWTYEGIPLGRPLFEEYWELCVRGLGMKEMQQVERYRTACEALRPEGVLYRGEFYRWGRVVSAGVETRAVRIGVQHGILNREHTVYQFCPGDLPDNLRGSPDHVHNCPAPDQLLGFGTYVQKQFDRWGGYEAERIVPTGGVRHDSLVHGFNSRSSASHSARRLQLDLPDGQPIVLVCTGLAQQAGLYFSMVAEALDRASLDAFIAVKLHHFHGGETSVHEAAKRWEIRDYAVFHDNIYRLLSRATVLVAGTSTLTVEAHLLDTPVVGIVAHPAYELYPFTDDGIAEAVCTREEMAEALQRVLCGYTPCGVKSEGREDLLRRHLHNEDKGACIRLTEWLQNQAR